jgi:HAD superfamily hydrolase (TIGR01509 family)
VKNRSRTSLRAVLFDWDGTLLNSYAADTRAYLAMFRAMGIAWGVRNLARHYSPNWYRVYRAARLPRTKWDEADRIWSACYAKERPALLPGARAIIRILRRDFVLGIVTSGNRRRVRQQLRDFEIADHFSACVCMEDSERKKPHPAPLQMALGRLRADPDECVYVGDSAEDIEMARRAGVRPIGVIGPFPTAAKIRAANPDVILRSIRELPSYIRGLI